MQVADKRRNNNKWPLIITDAEDNMLNVGESLRGKGAPRWFIFLSNRKKKKENTSLHVRLHPRHSQVTPDQPLLGYSLKFYEYYSSDTPAPFRKTKYQHATFKVSPLFFLIILKDAACATKYSEYSGFFPFILL